MAEIRRLFDSRCAKWITLNKERKGGEVGMKHNVPVQSLIDHIKTATDVDPWAKEMAEELLKEQEPVPVIQRKAKHMLFRCCGSCGMVITDGDNFCRNCGKRVKWE